MKISCFGTGLRTHARSCIMLSAAILLLSFTIAPDMAEAQQAHHSAINKQLNSLRYRATGHDRWLRAMSNRVKNIHSRVAANSKNISNNSKNISKNGLARHIDLVPPTAFDDMNAPYSVGTIWVDTARKAAYILVDDTGGAAVWEPITRIPPPSYAIGDTGPAGGIVFYVTDGGLHGLEATPADLANSPWGCQFRTIPGADGTAIGTGAQNTADIVAGCVSAEVTAAEVANDYALNGFTDWFLPSRDELNVLYLHRAVVGGFANFFYWSSSEDDSRLAWAQVFGNGAQTGFDKDNALGVRPVRAF